MRYADARNIQILLTTGTNGLTISIEDDGRGLPVDPPLVEGMGLRGMRERTSLLGGAFNVEGSDSGGFRVKAILPVTRLNQTR